MIILVIDLGLIEVLVDLSFLFDPRDFGLYYYAGREYFCVAA